MNSVRPISATYEEHISEALSATFTGWNFDWLDDRTSGEALTWSYPELAKASIADCTRLLDIDTGGGELLAGLHPLPTHTVATEAWEPNLPIARRRLEPLGVQVRRGDAARVPAEDGEFDLVLNRHGGIDADELWRVLAAGGSFLTQQVGSRNDQELFVALETQPSVDPDSHTLDSVVRTLRHKGFEIIDAREEMPAYAYHDIAAVVYQLRAVPWTMPDFDVQRYDSQLRRLDAQIRREGPFVTHNHRFLIKAGVRRL